MNPIGAQRTLRHLLYGGLASLALICSSAVQAASAGSGRAYGLQVTADVVGVGLGVPIADTGQKTAPPDFNTPTSVVSASVAAGVGNLLTVRTGVLNAATQSKLAQNSVVSSSSVNGLALKLAGLALGADTISSQAKMSCDNGVPKPEGSAQILGATGSLVGVSVAANTQTNLTIGVPTLGTMVGVVLHTNEQILSNQGKTLSVNALRVELVASALGARLLGASVVVGNSSATLSDCAPTVTLAPLPLITTSNQAAISVSGTCSAGSGNVAISSTPTGVSQSLPCSATGSYSGSVDTTALADGPVTLTASQSPAGPTSSSSQSTTKNTAPVLQPPVVTVVSAPPITAANQASYSVSGTCSANGASVSILVGVVPASAQCSGGLWSASGLNVTAVPNGAVTVMASQTVSGLLGSGSLTTSKDAAGVLPVVVVTSAPAITAANQASYTVSGTCSVNGTNVSVVIDTVNATVPCTGNIWAAAGLDVTALPNGAVTVTASQTVGNQTGSGNLGTTKDSAGAIPVVTISLAPAITLANQAAYTVSGSCSVNGSNVAVLVGSVAASALCANGSWSTAGLDVSGLPNGAVTVMASQTLGGQTGSASLVTSKDVTGAVPVVAVTSAPAITAVNQSSYTVSGTCSASGTNVAVLIGSISAAAPCNGGIWSTAAVDVGSLLDGAVTVTASQTVGGQTGSGSLQTSKNTVVDAPVVTISSAPAITALNEGAYTVSGTCSANGTNVAVLVGSVAASAPCTGNIWSSSGLDVSGLADGPVLVSASQTVGAQTGSGTLVTAKDTAGVAPVVTISAAPAITALNEAAYTVSGTCSVNGSNVNVLIGSISASATCDAGLWTTPALNVAALPDGAVTVTASQTANGQTGSGTLVIAKDTAGVAPSVAVTSAPAITGSNQASYVVSGTCSANGSNVAVLVGSIAATALCDGGVWATAGLDVSGLPDGAVTVTATQTVGDRTGSGSLVTSKSSASIAPVVSITSAPAITAANELSYTVSGTCSVNGTGVDVLVGTVAGSAPCSGGIWSTAGLNVSGLPNGPVSVVASQTVGGLTGSGSLVIGKDSEGIAPVVTITSAPAITAANQSAYTVSGTCSENGVVVTVHVGDVAAVPQPVCNGGIWSTAAMDVSALPDEMVLVTASQTLNGQTGSGSLVTAKDTAGIAPVVAISSAPAITAANQSAYTVSGTCTVDGSNVAVLVGSVAASAPCSGGSWTSAGLDVSGLPDGSVTVTASQTAGGLTGSGSLVTAKDTAGVAPSVSITSAAAITAANQSAYVVSGTCSVNGTDVSVLVGQVAAAAPCSSGTWVTAGMDVSGLPAGAVTVMASQTAGSQTGSVSLVINKEPVGIVPVVAITLPPDITVSNQAAYTVSGTCSVAGTNVAVQVGSIAASVACDGSSWTTAPLDVSGLPDGLVTVTASQTVSGGSGSASVVVNKTAAATAPVVTIGSAPAITLANQASYTVSGTCSASGISVAVQVGSVPASATCDAGAWTASGLNVSALPDGVVVVTAEQIVGGLSGSDSVETTKATAAIVPVVVITSAPAITALNEAAYTVSGTCSVNGEVVTVLVGSIPASATCSDGIWATEPINVSGLADGQITVQASQDAGGQTGTVSLVISKDSAGAAPAVGVVSAPPITAANQSAYTVSGTCSVNGAAVAVQIGSVPASAQCNAGIWSSTAVDVSALPDGPVTVTVSQTLDTQTGTGSLVTTKDAAGIVPVVSVTSAPAITLANQAAYTVSGSCSVGGSDVAVLVGSVSASAVCNAGIWSTAAVDVTALPDGAVTVMASQTASGQTGSGSLVTSKETAGAAPVVTVSSAPAITAANQASYTVSGSCSADGIPVAVQVGSVAASAPCAAGNWSAAGLDVTGLADGPVTVTAAQTVGSVLGSGSLVTNKSTGSVQPVVTITSAADITAANQSAYSVSGTCSVNGTNVDVLVGSVSTSVPCTSGSWMTAALNVSGLQDGTVTVTAQQTVGALVGSANVQVNKGTGVATPVVTITSAPAITAANASAYSVSGTCSVGGSNVDVQVGSVSATAPCMGGLWATEGMDVSGLADGAVAVTASQTDQAGNTGSITREVSKSTGSGGEPPEPPVARIAPQTGTWIISDELNGEPGRGMGIDIQDGVLFMQVYNYRQSGEATFHTALGTLRDNKVTAPLYFYEGGRYFGSEQRDGHAAGSPGNVVITFTSRSTGTIQFPGEPVKAMHRFDYEGTPAGVFSDPAFVDRWAMVELNSSNQPVRSWWADIGTSEQVSMSEDWAAAAMGWPYPPTVATAVHGFGGTLSGHVVAQCSYGGRGLVFNCSGNRAGANGAPVIAMTMQRGVDQLSGTVKEGGGDTRRLVGFRVARAAYSWQDNQSVRTSYYAPGYLPESGTWVVSSELRGLPGRGISIELQKPLNQEEHLLFMSVYDYQSDGKATFHSVLGAHDASTTPEPNTPDLPTVQYQGGRYFGGPAASARFNADAGPTRSIHFSAPSVGTLAFPGEQPLQIERFYYGVNKGSAQSLRGSWSVLSATDAMPSRIFRFQKRDENSVIDTDSGYVCVAEVLRQYNFRCTGPAGTPAFRFVAGFYGASSGIVGDAEDAPAITVMRVTDPNGEMVQAGD
ncbi:beta strand repeat-containing protein [Comamonas sp.]|uniref:beta strand repeat-containing protein n=1 Tax=Comamonas sp. TaxID=34028 RepID=UPI003D11BAAF